MAKDDDGRVEADLDAMREFARDCRSAGDDIAAAAARAGAGAARLAGSGGLAEQFWELCDQGQRRHMDLLGRAAARLKATARKLDRVVAELTDADTGSADAITDAASGERGE